MYIILQLYSESWTMMLVTVEALMRINGPD